MDEELRAQVARKLGELRRVLPARGRVLVLPHDYPDPDALASAAAMGLLLTRHFGLRAQIVFTGAVSRAENKAMLRSMKYGWRFLGQLSEPRKKVPCVFVDTAPWSGNVTVPKFGRPVAVIDHHPVTGRRTPKGLFVDIRSERGATAAMLAEYLQSAGVARPKWLSSMMAYAIATETLDLSRDTTRRDLDAYLHLLANANLGVMGGFRHAALPRLYYAHLAEAMRNGKTYGRVAWSHLPHVEQPEIVAEVAELLLRMERITWSFCTAFTEGRMVVSLRSSQPGARCGRILRRLVGTDGSGGGHQQMAAGYVRLEGMPPARRAEYLEQFVQSLVGHIEPRLKRNDEPVVSAAQPLTGIPRAAEGGA